MQQIYVASFYGNGYSRFMKYVHDVIDHPKREIIERRLKIINFLDEFGDKAARKAFGRARSTVYLWKQKLKKSGGKLSALAPGDKTPIHKRKRIIHPFIENFIAEYRTNHPGVDKVTITPALATACKAAGIESISESTVGRIIHDLKERGRIPGSRKITLSGKTGRLLLREPKRRKKKQRRRGYSPKLAGDLIQMDTISIFADGIKRYIFTAIDLRTRFAFAYSYKSNSSANGQDFLQKFIQVAPFATSRIQTDNGGEFEKHFDNFCQHNSLVHFFNYPRHPRSNAHLERFNRTIQQQLVNWHLDELYEPEVFNQSLMQYLIWYNTEKPHRSIGNIPPLRYYLNSLPSAPEKSNMLWTLTVC